MSRNIRYQGAIVHEHRLLLIRVLHNDGRSYWVIPGGGIEEGESEEDCVRREMHEETLLDVRVVRLLLDELNEPGFMYQRLKTYLCEKGDGEPGPGYEPEVEWVTQPIIIEIGWFDLSDPASWPTLMKSDPFTYPLVLRIQSALGY